MEEQFFTQPVLNSPYNCPARHWELDDDGQPTQRIIERRRSAELITAVPVPRRRRRIGKHAATADLRRGRGAVYGGPAVCAARPKQ